MAYALLLGMCLIEPTRGRTKTKKAVRDDLDLAGEAEVGSPSPVAAPFIDKVLRIIMNPAAAVLLLRVHRCELRRGDIPRLASGIHLPEFPARIEQLRSHLDGLAAREFTRRDPGRRSGRLGRAAIGEEDGSAYRASG